MRTLSIRTLLPLIIFIGMCLMFFVTLDRDIRTVPSPLVGKKAPSFTLQTMGKQTHSPDTYLGQRWLLNVWASWCAACRIEHPLFNQLANNSNITLIGLNYKDQPDSAHQWLTQHGNPYSAVLLDTQGSAGFDWGVYGVPETFLIDESGIIRHKHIGPITQTVLRDTIMPFFAATRIDKQLTNPIEHKQP